MVDKTTLGEVNNLIEFMDTDSVLIVKDTFTEYKFVKKGGAFYWESNAVGNGNVRKKLVKPPTLTFQGFFVFFPPSLMNKEFVQTKEVTEIILDGKTIYQLRKAAG